MTQIIVIINLTIMFRIQMIWKTLPPLRNTDSPSEDQDYG